MPPKAPLTSIECYTLFHLKDELASVQDALSVTETEETWDSLAKAIARFAALCNGNADKYPTELVAALRESYRPINTSLNSERTRLSGTATDFLTTAATALGSAFEPLIPHYLPTVLTLCTKANKVFVNRAKACIAAFVEHTQAPMIIHYSAECTKDKSVSLRLAAAEAMMLCMNSFNPPDLEKEARAKEIEATIRSTAVDASADVRKVARQLFDAYKILLPGRLHSFADPLTPRTRKYLDIKATAQAPAAPAPRSQPSSRPTSSQSVRSTQSDSRTTTQSSATTAAAQHHVKHVRSASSSQTTSQSVPARRPMRAPTPEVAVPPFAHEAAPRRPTREEPKRLKVDMPPPDYIPTHTGPQRPMSATELQFPCDRPLSGPQRVIRPDASATTANPMRTGPIRPALFNFKLASSEDANGEKKERVVGGARRVLRMPEPEPSAGAVTEDKGKAAPPIRPRVISTSRSTPAVPLHAAPVKEVKKLASSAGASSRPFTSTVPAKVGRTVSAAAAVSQGTASSRARAAERALEKEERRTREKTAEKEERRARERAAEKEERRAKEKALEREIEDKMAREKAQAREERRREKERASSHRDGEKERDRPHSRTSSKSSTAAAITGAAPTITMRDKTNRINSKSTSVTEKTKTTGKHSRKPSSKSPPGPEIGENVVPEEIPLPSTPELTPAHLQEASPPALIDLNTPERMPVQEESRPALIDLDTTEEEHLPALDLAGPILGLAPKHQTASPFEIALPTSRPGSDGSITPPKSLLTLPSIDINQPHTPTPDHGRPQRRAEVEQTPISALFASIERGWYTRSPLPTMMEEGEESTMVVDESENGEVVFGLDGFAGARVEPLFSRPSVHA